MKQKNEIQKEKIAIGYIRVSSKEQAQKGISLELQREKIRAYAKLKDLKLLKVVSDPGKSGFDLKRKGILDILERIKRKEISAVIVFKLDRLSRSRKDTETLIFDVFEKNGVDFISITENWDTSNAIGKFVLSIMAGINQLQRDQISEKTKEALAFLKSKGRYIGGSKFVAYGLRLEKNKKATIKDLKVVESEMKNVREMRKLRKKKWSLAKIGKKFKMSKSTIWYILRNPIYKLLRV